MLFEAVGQDSPSGKFKEKTKSDFRIPYVRFNQLVYQFVTKTPLTSDIRLISRLLSVSDCCFINVLFIAKLSSQLEILSTALQHQTDILTRDQFCPANGGVSFINTGNCYLESSQATSDWNEARAECQKNGGDLATIDSQATQDFLVKNLKGISS